MSENEQTGSAVPGQPPRGEHATRTTTDAAAAEPAPASGMPDIPWTPPPRRGARGRADVRCSRDRPGRHLWTESRRRPGTPRRSRSAPVQPVAQAVRGRRGCRPRTGSHPLDGLDPEPDGTRPDDGTRRRAWVLWAVIGGAVAIVVAAVVVFALLSADDAEPAAQTVTTTIDVPTPTAEPLDRTGATALVQALPGTVRQFVLGPSSRPTPSTELSRPGPSRTRARSSLKTARRSRVQTQRRTPQPGRCHVRGGGRSGGRPERRRRRPRTPGLHSHRRTVGGRRAGDRRSAGARGRAR